MARPDHGISIFEFTIFSRMDIEVFIFNEHIEIHS
jgi:hypothetical protein